MLLCKKNKVKAGAESGAVILIPTSLTSESMTCNQTQDGSADFTDLTLVPGHRFPR